MFDVTRRASIIWIRSTKKQPYTVSWDWTIRPGFHQCLTIVSHTKELKFLHQNTKNIVLRGVALRNDHL